MKSLFAGLFASTFLLTTFSFLHGQNEEPTLFVDSINLQVMTDLTIPGKDDPITLTQREFFNVPFSMEKAKILSPEPSFPEDDIAFLFPEMSFPEESVTLSLPESPLSEDAEKAVEVIYHFLLSEAPKGNYTFRAINQLQIQLSNLLSEAGYYGIAIVVDPDQIDMRTGDDYRDEGDTSLNLQIWIGEVVLQRTVAKGKRIKKGSLINHRYHKKIIKNSPFAPGSKLNATGEFLIDKPELNKYLERLNRSVNRRVDVAVSSAGEPGKLVLDYIVNEPKPWLGYIQVSNTGTEATGEWRERIGGVHYQLTGNDDVLAIDYFTAEFDSANAVVGSYDYPFWGPDYLISRTYASYSDFASENLIIAGQPDAVGKTVTYGTELRYTPFYISNHAASAILGVKYEDISAKDVVANDGFARFFSPYLRFELSKNKQTHRSFLSINFEKNLKDNKQAEFNNLGRQFTTDDYKLYSFRLFQSFFVEPLFPSYRKFSEGKWRANSLVNEFAFSLRGQYLTNDKVRLIPQKQYFAGGFFSARGYNESAVRGDTGTIGSVEYRIHLARLLKPYSLLEEANLNEQQPGNTRVQNRFNFRPPSLYGLPDWNFMLRGFVDWAKLSINESISTEVDQELLSFGVGFEFQYLSHLNVRLDYGVVADDLETSPGSVEKVEDDGDQGDSRFHLLVTYSF